MIFIDTSAIYALADISDDNHELAKKLFAKALQQGEQFLLHNYIIVEATALIQQRLGLSQAEKFLEEVDNFEIVWAGSELHFQGVELLLKKGTRKLSLVDCISFVVMENEGIARAFVFDRDFKRAGFKVYR